MEKLTNRSARRYLRQVKRLLPCSRKVKEKITASLRQSMTAFLAEQPDANAQSLQARFGPPKEIAVTCLENADLSELLSRLHTKRRILTIIVSTVIALLLSWGGFLMYTYLELKSTFDGHVERIIQVDSRTDESGSANLDSP